MRSTFWLTFLTFDQFQNMIFECQQLWNGILLVTMAIFDIRNYTSTSENVNF